MTTTKVGYQDLSTQWYTANELEREALVEAIIDAGNVKMLLQYASQVCCEADWQARKARAQLTGGIA